MKIEQRDVACMAANERRPPSSTVSASAKSD